MHIGITGFCQPRLMFTHEGLGIDYVDPLNFQWEFWDCRALADLGHTVFWLNEQNRPPLLDIVFCVIDREAPRAAAIAQSQDIPWVMQHINRIADYPDVAWDGIKVAMASAKAFTCTAPVAQRSVVKWMQENRCWKPCQYIPFGANMSLAQGEEVAPEQFTYVGGLVAHKRVDILVRAFADIPATLNLIGDGPESPHLALQARVLGTKLSIAGPVSNYAKYQALKRSHAMVLASSGEQFNIPTLEALACGTPVLARRLADMEDIYGDMVYWWNEPEELVMLAHAVLAHGRGDMAARRQWVIDGGFTLEARAAKLEKIFQEAVNG